MFEISIFSKSSPSDMQTASLSLDIAASRSHAINETFQTGRGILDSSLGLSGLAAHARAGLQNWRIRVCARLEQVQKTGASVVWHYNMNSVAQRRMTDIYRFEAFDYSRKWYKKYCGSLLLSDRDQSNFSPGEFRPRHRCRARRGESSECPNPC